MAIRKGIHISGHHVVSINAICLSYTVCTLYSKKMKGRTSDRIVFYIVFFNSTTIHTVF